MRNYMVSSANKELNQGLQPAAKTVGRGSHLAAVEARSFNGLPILRKLSIGAVNDPLEFEADAMADKVMRMPESSFIQRKCSHCEEEEGIQRKPLVSFIQKKATQQGGSFASDPITSKIQSSQGKGEALNSSAMSFMESRFGSDFSGVRIHTDSDVVQLSTELNAQAFTVGNDIYFNAGKYAPESSEGKHLLAHELTHTVQQHGSKSIQRRITEHSEEEYSTHAEAYAERSKPTFQLGKSAGGLDVNAYQFIGLTNNQALVIGGVHGSELSGVEVAEMLVQQLRSGPRPYYTVTIVPRLFPDNALTREGDPVAIRDDTNVGRYTGTQGVDPNRQMPELGRAFEPFATTDSRGRQIERENIMLLELINRIRPSRIVSIHAMHSQASAGIFADPRTEQNQIALGYDSDRNLALAMARHAQSRGAAVLGNRLRTTPNTTYALDPPIAQAGQTQTRSRGDANVPGNRGLGVSLGGWGSTAVCDALHPDRNRQAMRIITVEMPRGQRIQDMRTQAQRDARSIVVQAHVDAIREIFLGPHEVESNVPPNCP